MSFYNSSGAEAVRARGVVEQRVHIAVWCRGWRGGGGGGAGGALARRAPRPRRSVQHAHRARLALRPAPLLRGTALARLDVTYIT